MPYRSPASRNPTSAFSAYCSASARRPLHRRMLASSVLIIRSAHVSPQRLASAIDATGEHLGLVEASLEVRDVRPQALGPVDADPVAERPNCAPAWREQPLGLHEIAGQERRPRHVVARPRIAAVVAELLVHRQRLVEVAAAVVERATEQFGEAPRAQRVRQPLGSSTPGTARPRRRARPAPPARSPCMWATVPIRRRASASSTRSPAGQGHLQHASGVGAASRTAAGRGGRWIG